MTFDPKTFAAETVKKALPATAKPPAVQAIEDLAAAAYAEGVNLSAEEKHRIGMIETMLERNRMCTVCGAIVHATDIDASTGLKTNAGPRLSCGDVPRCNFVPVKI